ncbi:SDR family oxidoreductase [Paeniglutamicibacter cryotolerans]|uniref:NAD(P)-dependent dehydrogenase (Short-subunit alcohol dehydrogenase family) n=1 Tax=Paeniglutamicibacter cryotolerans TaxID=670079 RepID=A0A839QM26_9MICC|nr:SDR family oxidoreductase [Paeniglutamicibacter cryotolerans]MBB2997289.1 NAD(P)-dependent dehydrogenase (short-subunit alcohol dehydrogenase family) [Paeniglutamicibacter cryotolerans]
MTEQHPFTAADLDAALRVLGTVHTLDETDDRYIAVRRATGKMFKAAKRHRKTTKRAEIADADRATVERTATGSPDRLDDETMGLDLSSNTDGHTAGEYLRPRGCYICKERYTTVDAFHHYLCPTCAAEGRERRDARADLRGKRALLTGGRAKIGMHIALRLLRDGAHTTITTRFPRDAARRFAALEDSADWLHRLRIVGIDLRDPSQVIALADKVAADGPLDILINNAAQTVRRTSNSYKHLIESEATALPTELSMANGGPEVWGENQPPLAHPRALASAFRLQDSPLVAISSDGYDAGKLAELAMTAGSASLQRIAAGTAIDAGGLVPDVVDENSWTQILQDVDPLELLEVQLCNVTAPFLLASRLRPALAASDARRKYIVNVSAMEGQFSRRYKGAGHPHTNMAKASLNMLTRTSAKELLEKDRILMSAVDTGWITDERPHEAKLRMVEEGWHAPLDLIDGAARVYQPIVDGERGIDLYGCFLKDYEPSPW